MCVCVCVYVCVCVCVFVHTSCDYDKKEFFSGRNILGFFVKLRDAKLRDAFWTRYILTYFAAR